VEGIDMKARLEFLLLMAYLDPSFDTSLLDIMSTIFVQLAGIFGSGKGTVVAVHHRHIVDARSLADDKDRHNDIQFLHWKYMPSYRQLFRVVDDDSPRGEFVNRM
jgi:hypothetical protein